MFFIRLRNKIEHRHIDKDEIGIVIFGECQSILFNYENKLIEFFGEDYALNESLAFSLQFSRIRNTNQNLAGKTLLSKEVKELKEFIDKYRDGLTDITFGSQEYSVKLIQMPKIANANRSDLAVEFVNWNAISNEDKENYNKITTIIKDKVISKEVINPGKLKPGEVLNLVNSKTYFKINHFDHKCLFYIFSIRPSKEDVKLDPFETNTKYCHYDEVHNDYVYQEDWVNFLINIINNKLIDRIKWKSNCINKFSRL